MRNLIPILLGVVVLSSGCDPEEFEVCGDLVEHAGYAYSTVQIGEQCWFAENCRYLPEVSPLSSTTASYTEPFYYVYDYQGTDLEVAKSTENYQTYGVLYNWPAVMTEGVCPSGWHIPSDGEWQTMEVSLGMSEADASSSGWRGSPVSDYLKSSSGWNGNPLSPDSIWGNGSNSSGFNGLPAGTRFLLNYQDSVVDVSSNLGNTAYWWSSSFPSVDNVTWIRILDGNHGAVNREIFGREWGFSARCVRDY